MNLLTLKEILIYLNNRIKIILNKNIILLDINTEINTNKKNKFIIIDIKYEYLNKIFTYQYMDIITHTEITTKILDNFYISDFINTFENDLLY